MKNEPNLDRSWLSQFMEIDEKNLSDVQRQFAGDLRTQFPTGKVGKKHDGTLHFFALDPELGPVSMSLSR